MLLGRGGPPETRYAEVHLGYVGYQVFGSGDRDIMFITGANSNMDAIWEEPSAVRFFDRLAHMGRVIRYDMRGCGISDPVPGRNRWMAIEDNVDDVRVVLDAVGSERVVVYGDTEGGLSAMMLAAVDPDRVSALILVNAIAHLPQHADYPIGAPPQVREELSRQYLEQHGTTGAMLELTAPSVANDLRFRNWWTKYQRLAVPRGLVKTTFDWFGEVDARAALPLISAPTLVIGRRDARYHRPEYAEYLAANIRGSTLKLLDGADTIPFHAGDFAPVLDEVAEFLTGKPALAPSERVLATVLFTDIVGSTSVASSLGDQRWLDLLAEHNRIVRMQLARYRGREIKMTGDGCIATFEGPARAVACAHDIVALTRAVGLEVRAGIHTGEVEFRAGDIGGVGVHIASRVMASAASGGVLVSQTVHDLVVGSGIAFDEVGSVPLRGIPGEWTLYRPRYV
jgi:class 3 adenylate cyclase/pimeloyl-ACP methyl ester carboxylesterase